jgi:ubiquinone/menaquinone biosynthesis C-methylase UbiE
VQFGAEYSSPRAQQSGIKMNTEDQANNYNKIADYWNGSEFNRENGMKQHIRALQFSKKSGKAIDIGCGSSGRIIDLMLAHGFEAEGIDFSIEMLRHAKMRHPEVVFHHADICEWNFSGKYDFISAWDSIWHIPLENQELVLRKLCAALTDGGVIIFTSGAVDEAEDGSNHFLGQALYHATLGVPALLNVLSGCGCICRHLENDDWPNRHLYIIAQKKNA